MFPVGIRTVELRWPAHSSPMLEPLRHHIDVNDFSQNFLILHIFLFRDRGFELGAFTHSATKKTITYNLLYCELPPGMVKTPVPFIM